MIGMKSSLGMGVTAFLAMTVIGAFAPSRAIAWQAPATEKPKAGAATTVELSIRFADGTTRKFEPVAYKEGMTVLDLMEGLKATDKSSDKKGLRFEFTGSGATSFLTSIDGVENEAGRGSKAWIFRVNGKLGNRSFGTTTLKPGDAVLWHFGKYEPE